MRRIFVTIILGLGLVISAEPGLTLESDVTIRHPGKLPTIEIEPSPDYAKGIFLPDKRAEITEDTPGSGIRIRELPVPDNVNFTPTRRNRYRLIRGNVSQTGGRLYIGKKYDAEFSAKVSTDGNFTIGPIPSEISGEITMYYELTDRSVQVVFNDGPKIRPVTLKLGTHKISRVTDRMQTYQVTTEYEWQDRALKKFQKFVRKEPKDGPFNNGYRIEFMRDLQKHTVRRNGTHHLYPME